jgi:hypothetical protein
VKICITGEFAEDLRERMHEIVPDADVVAIGQDGSFDSDPDGIDVLYLENLGRFARGQTLRNEIESIGLTRS